ncbi:MAG: OmpA family protein [Magnetococcales bacterium]|nr:OmpA family protein [Magnetococcales bacterium]
MAKVFFLYRNRTDNTDNPFWISYADLMTALVMLFLVVMSISMIAVASRQVVEKKIRETDILGLLDVLEEEAAERGVDLAVNRSNYTLSFGEQARFGHDSFQLSQAAQKRLKDFVPLLLDLQSREKGQRWLKRVHVEGYTDEIGTYLYNVNLSLNRAQAVVCALFDGDLTSDEQRTLRQLLIIDGAATTSIKASREESRRVEIRLEFHRVGEKETSLPTPEMALGHCAIRVQGLSLDSGQKPGTETSTPNVAAPSGTISGGTGRVTSGGVSRGSASGIQATTPPVDLGKAATAVRKKITPAPPKRAVHDPFATLGEESP